MREIKFRAKATQDYVTSADAVQEGDWVKGYYYFCRNRMSGIIVTELGAESGGVGSGIVQVEIKVDYETRGEYTGLKDKNGKEIWEGDLIEIRDIITGANWPGPGFVIERIGVPVVWDKENALWSFDIENDVRYSDYYDKDDKHARINFRNHIRGLMFDGDSGNIIGNIYENPDLLEGK